MLSLAAGRDRHQILKIVATSAGEHPAEVAMKFQSLNTRDQPDALRGRGDLAFRQTLVLFAY